MKGTTAKSVHGVYPAVTYPSHTSMITGLSPLGHGILQNDKFDPMGAGRGLYIMASDIKVPTLFDAVKAKGLGTSAIHWPVTAFSPSIDYSWPDVPPRTPVEADFTYHGCLQGDLVKSFMASAEDMVAQMNDGNRTALAIRLLDELLPQGNGPHFNALHMTDFDHEQHVNGVFSEKALRALEEEDAHLGHYLEAIERHGIMDRSYIMLVSDHGFTNATTILAPGVLLASQGLIRPGTEWKVQPYVSSGVFAIYINRQLAQAEQDRIERQVKQVVHYLSRNSQDFGIIRSLVGYSKVNNAGLKGHPGAFAVLEAGEEYGFSPETTGLLVRDNHQLGYLGRHGYNPEDPRMHTSFV